jgi:selenide,water dikinase
MSDLSAMLQGATEIMQASGCVLTGTHTASAAELALSIAITGLADAGAVLRRQGLRPGDRLILTKPLGTGIVLAGNRRGNATAQGLLAAIGSMRTTNAAAARIAMTFGPTAGTRIGSLGLAGHLHRMLEVSGVGAVIQADTLPALPGARALAAHGIEDKLAADNRRFLDDSPNTELLADPQISGGLLVGVPADRADACLAALHDNGLLSAAIVGYVELATANAGRIRIE